MLCLGLVICFGVFAQYEEPELAKRLQGKTRLKDIMETVNEFYGVNIGLQSRDPKAGLSTQMSPDVYRKLKKWARFEYENLPILDAKGQIPDYPRHLQRSMDKYMQSHAGAETQSSGGLWFFLGPQTLSYGHGRSIGLGRIDRITFHPTQPNTFFVGAPSGGLWRTVDGGSNYTCLTNNLANPSVSGIVVDWSNPSTLYMLTGDGDSGGLVAQAGYRRNSIGVLKSTDNGYSWQQTGTLTTGNFRGFKLIQSPTNANTLLAATNAGVFRTTNGGATWTLVKAGIVWDLAFQPQNGNRVYAAITDGGGITRFETSVNGGAGFSATATFDFPISGANRVSIGVTPANTNRVYLLCGPGNPGSNNFFGFYRSTNAGSNFTRTATSPNVFGNEDGGGSDQSTYDNCIGVSPTDVNRIWVGGLTIFTSGNGGDSFSNQTLYFDGVALERDDHIHPDVHSVLMNPLNNNLYATTDGGVYVSSNNGSTWGRRFNNLPTTQIYHMDVYEASPHHILIGSQDNGLHKRFGNTSAFEQTQEGDGFAVQFKSDESDDFYAVINSKVFRLMSNGLTQLEKWDFGGFFPTLAIHQTDNSKFYTARQYFVGYNVNAGIDDWGTRQIPASWALITCPSNSSRIYGAGDSVFAGTSSGAMWRSDNSGDTWTNVSNNPGFPAASSIPKITHIAVNPTNSNQVWVTLGGTNSGAKVLYSNNAGGNWTNVTGSLPDDLPANCIAIDENNNAYCGNDFGVFFRAAGWTDWKPFYNNLPRIPVSDLHISTSLNRIRAATFGRGIWESDLYSTCNPSLYVSGDREGQHFFDAGVDLSTAAKTMKGEGSVIMYRAGSYVQGITGFEVANGSVMRAWTGPCGQGIPGVAFTPATEDFAGYRHAELPVREGKKFPFGVIKNWKWDQNNELVFTIRQETADTVQVVLVNEEGKKLAVAFENNQMPAQSEKTIRLHTGAFAGQKLRLLLFHHQKLVHWQELN